MPRANRKLFPATGDEHKRSITAVSYVCLSFASDGFFWLKNSECGSNVSVTKPGNLRFCFLCSYF